MTNKIINDGGWYEAEDIGCDCNDAGIDSEWEWKEDEGCYVCTGCGARQ